METTTSGNKLVSQRQLKSIFTRRRNALSWWHENNRCFRCYTACIYHHYMREQDLSESSIGIQITLPSIVKIQREYKDSHCHQSIHRKINDQTTRTTCTQPPRRNKKKMIKKTQQILSCNNRPLNYGIVQKKQTLKPNIIIK